ncbi:MAG TPA: hypothetical protein VIC02_10155, partial [Kineobactrum sp.]
MSQPDEHTVIEASKLQALAEKLDRAIDSLADTRSFAKGTKIAPLFDLVRRVLLQSGGCAVVEERAQRLEEAGVFAGSDWAHPHILIPALSASSLRSPEPNSVVIEAMSELRLLAIATGDYLHPTMSREQAHQFLTQVLAINLELLFGASGEAERAQQGRLALIPRVLLRHLAERIGYEHIIDRLIEEIWRILQQRPIQVDSVKQMITQIAICQSNPYIDLGVSGQGADRLISSLYGPTQACREDPGVAVYLERLESMDSGALQYEATGIARAMHDTGLVSPYHAVLLRYLLHHGDHLLSEAMGLSSTGRDCLLCYGDLVRALINEAVYPETAQGIFGLAQLLERGILYQPALAPALWRQLALPLSAYANERLTLAFGPAPSARAWLLQGVLCMLGQPLGVGQGNNPTCQSARALSMWAYNDPDYLLQMVVWAA